MMESCAIEMEGTWEEIASQSSRFAGRRLRVIILPEDDNQPAETPFRPIEDIIAEMAAEVPEEEWAKLPNDLSENLDHYIYGVPRHP